MIPNALINSEYGSMIINIHDQVIGKSISTTGYWAKADIELIVALLKNRLEKQEKLMFYDVGANIGTHSLAISKILGSRVQVRAFEAQRQIFNMLCGTIALNGLDNVYCYNNAVSDKKGEEIKINLLDYGSPNNFGALEILVPKNSDQQGVTYSNTENVATLRLDDFEEHVDFIKIDVEGMEDRVIKGANVLISQYRPGFFVEIHKTDSKFILDYFQSIGGYIGFLNNIDLILLPISWGLQINEAQRVI